MSEGIPDDVVEYVRRIFAQANAEATRTLARQPAIHEEQLDFQIFAVLDGVGPVVMPASGAAVEIETHWLGGRRHYGGRWEIADIALVVILRRSGKLLWRKVALLQSKRLYSREIPVVELEHSDYMIGIGRIIDRNEPVRPLTTERAFQFSADCVYGAMAAGSEQVARIDSYMRSRALPVYYTLYNPPRIPYRGVVPRKGPAIEDEKVQCGCRVLTALEAHSALAGLPAGKTPSFSELAVRHQADSADPYDVNGWRFEVFVADEVLRCREGRVFSDRDDKDLQALLYERTAPIASAIAVTIDLPGEPARRQRGRRIDI